MKQHIDKIEQIIDKEIEIYQNMQNSSDKKREAIVKGNLDALKDIDTQMIEQTTGAALLAQQRQNHSIPLGKANMSFKEIAQLAYDFDKEQSERLFNKKHKLEKVVKRIEKANKINQKLIQNSLLIMEKTMSIIINTVLPEAGAYNQSGKTNKMNDTYKMSSISKDA